MRSNTRMEFLGTQQIDVMFLYDEAALERGVANTPAQMETLIADELPASNEAADNSLIDLRFNLVHAGEVKSCHRSRCLQVFF